MTPFFGCRSIPGFLRGACANCFYHIEGRRCTYSKDEGVLLVEAGRARQKLSPSTRARPRQQTMEIVDLTREGSLYQPASLSLYTI